jgi:sensor domain DACNV-containing protein
MSDTFSFNPEVLKQLHEKYEDAITHERFNKELPSELLELLNASQLEGLVKTALWASLKHEEGRFHNFSLLLAPPEAFYHPYIFDKPLLFDEEHLVKLAPALAPSANFIGLWPDDSGSIRIWGFASTIEMERSKPKYARAYLFCEVIGPGYLLLSASYRSIGMIFFTALITGTRTEFTRGNAFLESIVPDIKGKRLLDLPLADIRSASDYRTIAKAMRSHQHGGTLLIVQENSQWNNSTRQPIPYIGQGYQSIKNSINDRNEIMEDWRQSLAPSDRYLWAFETAKNSLNIIGQLTAVDGATVISRSFDVLAFGAKIKSKSNPEKISVSTPFENDLPRVESLSDLGGTRHQSAAQFIYEQKDAIAIVASQDGRVSLMKWDYEEDMLCVMRPAEYVL